MNKISKGRAGYIDNQKKFRLIIIIAGLVIILADFFTGLIITGTRNNLFTIVAIVLVLPEGKFLATYLALVKYKSTPKELVDRIESKHLTYSVVYDCVFSTKERIVPVYAAVIGPDFVLCYGSTKGDRKLFESSLEAFVREGRVKIKASLLSEEKAFFNRLEQLSANAQELDDDSRETMDLVRQSVLAMCI